MGLFALALAIAWARFGRHRHISLWACAFLMATIGNLGFVAAAHFASLEHIAAPLAIGSSLACAALFAQGFRQRAGIVGWRRVAALSLLMGTGLALATARNPLGQFNQVLVHLCDAVLYLLAFQALRADLRGGDGAVRANFWMLAAFIGFIGVVIPLTFLAGKAGFIPVGLDDALLLLGVPLGMAGLGLFSMLLVASDLSDRLERLAALDPLTGVLNRRGFDHAAGRMLAQCRRFDRPLSIVIADLDRFKAINDRFGHALGDLVLQRFAAHCEAEVRQGDLVGRLGGEEFVIVLADASLAAATEVLERLRAGFGDALADLALPVAVTASFGISALAGREDTLAAMLVRADAALYDAKGDGRDRISVARADAADPARTDARFLAAFADTTGDRREAARL